MYLQDLLYLTNVPSAFLPHFDLFEGLTGLNWTEFIMLIIWGWWWVVAFMRFVKKTATPGTVATNLMYEWLISHGWQYVVDDKSLLGVVFQPTRQVAARGEAQEPKTTWWEFFLLFFFGESFFAFFSLVRVFGFFGLWIIAFFLWWEVSYFLGFG